MHNMVRFKKLFGQASRLEFSTIINCILIFVMHKVMYLRFKLYDSTVKIMKYLNFQNFETKCILVKSETSGIFLAYKISVRAYFNQLKYV